MTIRFAMAVALLLVLLAQAWGLVSVWRDDPLGSLASTGKKEVAAAVVSRTVSMQPSLGVVPDLNQGYLFSPERSLAAGSGKGGQAQNAANVSIDKIHYSGAIIADNPKALLSYSLGTLEDASGGAQKQGFLRVGLGDTVNGYKVTDILPEKIIFSRDGQQITKLLYDKAKDRSLVPAPLSSRGPSGQTPAAAPAPQAPGQNGVQVLAPSPVAPAAKIAQPSRTSSPRKPVPPPPSDEELRKHPLRKRPEPPPS
jgi:hypothetical protein